MVKKHNIIRTAQGAGRWFPATERELRGMVEGFMANARPRSAPGRIIGAIAPHAGFLYSGSIAGYTFKAISRNAEQFGPPDTVVVLGFSHREQFPGTALMDGRALQTPLGTVELDTEAVDLLFSSFPDIRPDYSPHRLEHSAENLVPFMQAALPGTKLVIALTGSHDEHIIMELLESLSLLSKKKRILLAASSDMLHDPDYELVSKTDRDTLRLVEKMDYNSIKSGWSYDRQIFCGIIPVLTTIAFAQKQGCKEGQVLSYKNSGDDFPESRGEWVVGYGAAVFTLPPDQN